MPYIIETLNRQPKPGISGMIVAMTGHRPEKCEDEAVVRLKFRNTFRDTDGIDCVITGMAAGVDLWAADEARLLGIEIWAARPWKGHKARKGDEQLYARVLEAASRVVDVDESEKYPGPWVYDKRNRWMVDNATHVLAYWDGTAGGTANCRNYALEVDVPVRNIYYDPPF